MQTLSHTHTRARTHAHTHTQSHAHAHAHARAHSRGSTMQSRYRALSGRRKRGFKVLVTKQDLNFTALTGIIAPPKNKLLVTRIQKRTYRPPIPPAFNIGNHLQCQRTFEAEAE